MSEILHPGSGVLFMKVGTHAQETLVDIIARKTREIEDAGVAFWGYGGGTCHPNTMVQPFAKEFEKRGEVIQLCMQEMVSKHFAEPVRAEEYSIDGLEWKPVPDSINVLGSRYALVIRALKRVDFEIPLDQTRVAIGNSEGRLGSKYISGRVDKGCLEMLKKSEIGAEEKKIRISLAADVIAPYAVFLRNKPVMG